MQKMTIHRALTELKTINARIEKLIDGFIPCGFQKKGKLVGGVFELEKFNTMVPADYQQIVDLIDRKNKIKSAIVMANGVTMVTVASVQMTIADAINRKASIEIHKKLLSNMKQKYKTVIASIEKNNTTVEQSALKLAEVALGKENVKIDSDAVRQVTKVYVEDNQFTFIDPLKVEQKIKEIEKDIDSFQSDVDSVLSEINAVTFIEV